MSKRNTPPAYIDLIEYVKVRTRCTTTMAKRVLMSGALRVDSHPVGFKILDRSGKKELDPYLPAEYRHRITIQWSHDDKD